MAHACHDRAHTFPQKYHVLCDGSILTIIFIMPKSDTPSGFDLVLESKSDGLSDLETMNVMVNVCCERAHGTFSVKIQCAL